MSDRHFEPFLYLAGLTHDDALVAWGGFWFRDPDLDGADWQIVEDPDLAGELGTGRRASIGAESEPFGHAEVEVVERATGEVAARVTTDDRNHVWVRGLEPDTEYEYHVRVDGEPWAEGERHDWVHDESGADLLGTTRTYDRRFRTFPAPDDPAPLRFAVLGDYGVGILASDGKGQRQRRLADALERAVDHAGVRLVVTTGDNVYIGEEDTVAGSGEDDDDWYFSFYAPYRYTISRVPVYPGVGNHDASDTESADDREQLADNLFTRLRFAEGSEVGRSSVDPGLFYRFSFGADVEFVAVDTTMASDLEHRYYIDNPEHRDFLEDAFPDEAGGATPPWRIPFSHHPPFCAGPHHANAEHLVQRLVPLLERSGTQVMFSGHEHNFQHAERDGIDYFVSGAAGKLREGEPDGFREAHTRSWAAEGHFLVVDVERDRMTVHPVTDVHEDGSFTYLRPRRPDGRPAETPIVVDRRRVGR